MPNNIDDQLNQFKQKINNYDPGFTGNNFDNNNIDQPNPSNQFQGSSSSHNFAQSNLQLKPQSNPQLAPQRQPQASNHNTNTKPSTFKKTKKSTILGKLILGTTAVLALASLGLLINNNYFKPFGKVPSSNLLEGSVQQLGDLGLFKDSANKKYCSEIPIKPTDCEDRPQYEYYSAGQFRSGELAGYTRIIAITKNYDTEPLVFATKDNTKYTIKGSDKLNEKIAELASPNSKINASKIEKFKAVPDSMIPVVDYDIHYSLSGFQSIDKFPTQKISTTQKNIGTQKRQLPNGETVDVTKFQYSLATSANQDLQELGSLKGTNSKIYTDKNNKNGKFNGANNKVILTDSTGLGFDYYLQFKDKLDNTVNNTGAYINQAKQIQEFVKTLNDKLIQEGKDPKQKENQELILSQLRASFPSFRNINPACPVQFGVYSQEFPTQLNSYSVYGSGSTPYTTTSAGVAKCYGEYQRFGIVDKFDESQYQLITTTKDGIQLFTPKTSTPPNELIKQYFASQINQNKDVQNNSEKTVFENFNPNVTIPSLAEYSSKNPVLVAKDPFGRAIIMGEADYYGVN